MGKWYICFVTFWLELGIGRRILSDELLILVLPHKRTKTTTSTHTYSHACLIVLIDCKFKISCSLKLVWYIYIVGFILLFTHPYTYAYMYEGNPHALYTKCTIAIYVQRFRGELCRGYFTHFVVTFQYILYSTFYYYGHLDIALFLSDGLQLNIILQGLNSRLLQPSHSVLIFL